MPMTLNIGIGISSIIFGRLSDRIGRRPCILISCYLTTIGSMLRYCARGNYWIFCATSLAAGLANGVLPVAVALASDLTEDRYKTDSEIAIIIAINMIGRTGGGLIAIAMQSVGLFAPLWASAAITLLAGIVCQIWLTDSDSVVAREPSNNLSRRGGSDDCDESCCETEPSPAPPTTLDIKALVAVLFGELADNLGTMGLVPMCLSPLLFQTFYANFVETEEEPVMSATSYKFIYAFVATAVIPGAAIAPLLFKKIGPALSASLANVLTGVVTIALLQIANLDATQKTYILFAAVLYCFFPLTVVSQVSTGPMLDRIAPEHLRGRIQGANMATMNLTGAIAPFLFVSL